MLWIKVKINKLRDFMFKKLLKKLKNNKKQINPVLRKYKNKNKSKFNKLKNYHQELIHQRMLLNSGSLPISRM